MRKPAAAAAVLCLLGVGLCMPAAGGSGDRDDGASRRVRPSALAGTWYPSDAGALADTVDALMAAAATESPSGSIRALVAPHAGYVYSGPVAASAFALIRGARYRRVVVLAPAHHAGFDGLSISDVDAYETPLGRLPLDAETIARLRASALVRAESGAHRREHAIEIELPFLQRALSPGWRLVPILVGRLDGDEDRLAADLLRPFLDEGALLVVSTDFTHYGPGFGYVPFPPDRRIAERIRALDDGAIARIVAHDAPGLLRYRAETGITICGLRPLTVLLRLLPSDARVHRLSYAASGARTGDWRQSVSYASFAVTTPDALSAGAETHDQGAHGFGLGP